MSYYQRVWTIVPSQLFPGTIPWSGINIKIPVIRGSRVTLKDTNTSFGLVSTSVILSRPGWSRTSDPFVWLSPGEKKDVFDIFICIWWCIRSWLISVSVKILMSLFFFLQELNARSCFKGSLMPPLLSYIMQ